MASSSGASGPGRTPGPPKSLAQQFYDHRLLSRSNTGGTLPLPLDMEKYMQQIASNQMNHCLKLAIDFYNNHPDNKGKGLQRLRIDRVVGVKSNMFILENVDPICCFHLYFKRETKARKYYYFAELEGKNGPETVTICQEVVKETASAVNCTHCFGGVLHPPAGFIGQRQPPIVGYRMP